MTSGSSQRSHYIPQHREWAEDNLHPARAFPIIPGTRKTNHLHRCSILFPFFQQRFCFAPSPWNIVVCSSTLLLLLQEIGENILAKSAFYPWERKAWLETKAGSVSVRLVFIPGILPLFLCILGVFKGISSSSSHCFSADGSFPVWNLKCLSSLSVSTWIRNSLEEKNP